MCNPISCPNYILQIDKSNKLCLKLYFLYLNLSFQYLDFIFQDLDSSFKGRFYIRILLSKVICKN